jgi:hypothetical protein
MYRILFLLSCLTTVAIHGQELRDPTQPIKIDAGSNNSFAIKAIIISPTKKLVLIGSRTLTIGDEIMGKKIIDIDSNMVKLKADDGEIINLSMFDTILKKAENNKEDKP